MPKEEVQRHYLNKLNNYGQIFHDKHRSRWLKGDWTDDTDQFLCILDSILKNQDVVLCDIAKRFYQWFIAGSILGAKFGYSSIPTNLIEGLNGKDLLLDKRNLILELLEKRNTN